MTTLDYFSNLTIDVESLKQIIAEEPDFVHFQNELGETALFLAVEFGSEYVSLLLKAGADANGRNHLGETPLHQAAQDSDEGVAQLLIEHGAAVDEIDNDGQTALHAAAVFGALEVAEILIHNGAKLNIQDKKGYTPLHYSVCPDTRWGPYEDYLQVANLLLRAGADPNICTNGQMTVLAIASQCFANQNRAIIETLIKHGAQ
jgi:serine/threonine-protein phosphatase 6 regulatory ankyrin repeat subunit B